MVTHRLPCFSYNFFLAGQLNVLASLTSFFTGQLNVLAYLIFFAGQLNVLAYYNTARWISSALVNRLPTCSENIS